MDKQTIAVFVGTYLPFSETFIYDQLQRQNHFQAHVFAYGKGEHRHRFTYPHKTILSPLEKPLYTVLGKAPRFSQSLNRINPALIHAHFGPNGVLATPFARSRNIPLAVTFHGHDIGGLLGRNRHTIRYLRYNIYAQKMFEYGSMFLAASKEIADMLKDIFKVPEEKVILHRLGISLENFVYTERPHRPAHIIMIGRFVEKKGFIYGLEAFSRVHKKFPDSKITIVGNGPLRPEYETLIHAKGIQEAVSFPGVLTADKIRSLMHSADIIMAPSVVSASGDRESGILVLKEAGATGLPGIGTMHGGIPEIIEHEKTGFLVPERDVLALGNYLEKLVIDHSLRTELGRNARNKIKKEYNSELQNQRLESIFTEIIKKHKK
ncbi:MAG: glycosyltransferase [Fibrobacteria bacterium]|nr:glycosyltransferase [Fibrobacteria bacterium]